MFQAPLYNLGNKTDKTPGMFEMGEVLKICPVVKNMKT